MGCSSSESKLTTGTSTPADRSAGDHPFERRVVGDTREDQRVVAAERPCDVFDRLPSVKADLFAADRHRVAAELDDRHLRGVARSRRRMLEDQRRSPSGEWAIAARRLRQVEDLGDPVLGKVADLKEVHLLMTALARSFGHRSRPSSTPFKIADRLIDIAAR